LGGPRTFEDGGQHVQAFLGKGKKTKSDFLWFFKKFLLPLYPYD